MTKKQRKQLKKLILEDKPALTKKVKDAILNSTGWFGTYSLGVNKPYKD